MVPIEKIAHFFQNLHEDRAMGTASRFTVLVATNLSLLACGSSLKSPLHKSHAGNNDAEAGLPSNAAEKSATTQNSANQVASQTNTPGGSAPNANATAVTPVGPGSNSTPSSISNSQTPGNNQANNGAAGLTNFSGIPNLPGLPNLSQLPGLNGLNNLPGLNSLPGLNNLQGLNNLPGLNNLAGVTTQGQLPTLGTQQKPASNSNNAYASYIQQCLIAWGTISPFTAQKQPDSVLGSPTNALGHSVNLVDSNITNAPTLVLVFSSWNATSDVSYLLENPNGWYCVVSPSNSLAQTTINIKAAGHLATSSGIAIDIATIAKKNPPTASNSSGNFVVNAFN